MEAALKIFGSCLRYFTGLPPTTMKIYNAPLASSSPTVVMAMPRGPKVLYAIIAIWQRWPTTSEAKYGKTRQFIAGNWNQAKFKLT